MISDEIREAMVMKMMEIVSLIQDDPIRREQIFEPLIEYMAFDKDFTSRFGPEERMEALKELVNIYNEVSMESWLASRPDGPLN